MAAICKGLFRTLGSFGLCALSTAAVAAPGFTVTFQIVNLIPRENCLDIVATAPITSPMSCTVTDKFRLPNTATNYQVVASGVMTAFSTGKSLKVWGDSCDTDGVGKFIAASVDR